MTFWQRFLAFLATVLEGGVEHELYVRLDGVDEATEEERTGFPDDASDEQVEILAATYNVEQADLDEATEAIRAAATADGDDRLDHDQVLEAADLIDGVRFVEEVREESEAALETERQAALDRIAGEAGDDEADLAELEALTDEERAAVAEYAAAVEAAAGDDGDGEDGGDDGGDGSGDGDGSEDGDGDGAEAEAGAEPVLASASGHRPRIGRVAARGRARRAPQASSSQASGDRRDWRMLQGVDDRHDRGDTISHEEFCAAAVSALDDVAASGEKFSMRLGRRVTEFPEERRLGTDPSANGRTVRDLVAAAQAEAAASATPGDAIDTLVAGALCVLPTPIYEIASEGSTAMPVHDFLPSLNAARGGVSQRPGMKLGDTIGAVDTDASGVTIWTMANQADPGSDGPATKRVFHVECPDENVETEIYAVVARIQFDNFMARYDPELVDTATGLQEVATARIAETEVITAIHAASTPVQSPEPVVSFAREFLSNVEWLVQSIRSANRLPETFVFDALFPFWVRAAVRDDMMREIPGSTEERMAVADAEIDRWARVRGIRLGWFIDTQQIAEQAAGAQLRAPAAVTGYIFEPGHHVLLDGGREDFGFVRDSTLLDTNHVQSMGEVMEAVHSPGLWSYRLTMDVCLTGATGGTVEVPCIPTSG